MDLQQKQIGSENQNVLTEPVTPEESAAIIALWNKKQQEANNSTKLADVAEALNLSPKQAERLLEQVRSEQKRPGWLSRTLQKNHLVFSHHTPALIPWISVPSLFLLGLGIYFWTFLLVESWASFGTSGWEKVGFGFSDAGLWLLFVQFTRSIYQDMIGRRRKQW